MNYNKILKVFNLIGGIYEIIFGLIMILWIQPLLSLLGVSNPDINFPIFNQTAGLLAIIFGISLAISAVNIERYILIPILSIILRVAIQFVILPNIFVIPEMAVGLIIFAMIDLIFGIITIFLIIKIGYPIRKIFKNDKSN